MYVLKKNKTSSLISLDESGRMVAQPRLRLRMVAQPRLRLSLARNTMFRI